MNIFRETIQQDSWNEIKPNRNLSASSQAWHGLHLSKQLMQASIQTHVIFRGPKNSKLKLRPANTVANKPWK